MPKKNNALPLVHPGAILREDLMRPLRFTLSDLARELKISTTLLSAALERSCALTEML